MVQNIGIILFGIAILCLIWTIASLVKPQIIIRWAIPEKQTRLRALGFGLSLTLMFGCAGYALQPTVSWWAWVLPAFFAMTTTAMWDYFEHTDEYLVPNCKNKDMNIWCFQNGSGYGANSTRSHLFRRRGTYFKQHCE